MTVIVSDNSPLSYLVEIGCEGCLPELYGSVLIPEAVLWELQDPRTPTAIRDWLKRPPAWLIKREVQLTADPELDELDLGERSAIQLAVDERAELLLMDERAGVAAARARGLTVTGTLGVLLQASRHGLIDLDSALAKLRSTTFRSTPELIEEIKRRAFGAKHD